MKLWRFYEWGDLISCKGAEFLKIISYQWHFQFLLYIIIGVTFLFAVFQCCCVCRRALRSVDYLDSAKQLKHRADDTVLCATVSTFCLSVSAKQLKHRANDTVLCLLCQRSVCLSVQSSWNTVLMTRYCVPLCQRSVCLSVHEYCCPLWSLSTHTQLCAPNTTQPVMRVRCR